MNEVWFPPVTLVAAGQVRVNAADVLDDLDRLAQPAGPVRLPAPLVEQLRSLLSAAPLSTMVPLVVLSVARDGDDVVWQGTLVLSSGGVVRVTLSVGEGWSRLRTEQLTSCRDACVDVATRDRRVVSSTLLLRGAGTEVVVRLLAGAGRDVRVWGSVDEALRVLRRN